jgi:hypothetical protein
VPQAGHMHSLGDEYANGRYRTQDNECDEGGGMSALASLSRRRHRGAARLRFWHRLIGVALRPRRGCTGGRDGRLVRQETLAGVVAARRRRRQSLGCRQRCRQIDGKGSPSCHMRLGGASTRAGCCRLSRRALRTLSSGSDLIQVVARQMMLISGGSPNV